MVSLAMIYDSCPSLTSQQASLYPRTHIPDPYDTTPTILNALTSWPRLRHLPIQLTRYSMDCYPYHPHARARILGRDLSRAHLAFYDWQYMGYPLPHLACGSQHRESEQMDCLGCHYASPELPKRTSHSSRLEFSELKHCPFAHRLCCLLQHVRAGFWNHICEHLPQG